MYLPKNISDVDFKSYFGFSKVLDSIWGRAKKNPADAAFMARMSSTLAFWRQSINKMRIYSSSELSVLERINLNRASKDIDSLLYRLRKISGIVSTKIGGAENGTKSEESDTDDSK
jgi:hypothetical protein